MYVDPDYLRLKLGYLLKIGNAKAAGQLVKNLSIHFKECLKVVYDQVSVKSLKKIKDSNSMELGEGFQLFESDLRLGMIDEYLRNAFKGNYKDKGSVFAIWVLRGCH